MGISFWVLWVRYREGRLVTPASGLHLQFLIFFGVGGFAFFMFPDAEPFLPRKVILEEINKSIPPLLLGYCIAIGIERCLFRRRFVKNVGRVDFKSELVFIAALVGFIGCLLEGRLTIPGLSAVPTYLKHLFFPSFLLAITNFRSYGPVGTRISICIVLLALIVGVWSPWRSVLIVLLATVLIAVVLVKVRWLPIALLVITGLMMVLIPFQNAKKDNFDDFIRDPIKLFENSMDMDFGKRFNELGVFVAKRINYLRELVYVNAAIDRGMYLKNGETYVLIFAQLIPRSIWHGKPQVQKWAGYDLPREVGLLQKVDESTSWAVNSLAEVTYNFGLRSLIWFVPVIFLATEVLERVMQRITHTNQASLLGNIALFFLCLGYTSVIFASSQIVALFVIIKFFDLMIVTFGIGVGKKSFDEPQRVRRKFVVHRIGVGRIRKV